MYKKFLLTDNCSSLVDGLSPELAAMLLACVIGGYTLIGGLGATFYVSYFNTALIFVLILMLVVEVRALRLSTKINQPTIFDITIDYK